MMKNGAWLSSEEARYIKWATYIKTMKICSMGLFKNNIGKHWRLNKRAGACTIVCVYSYFPRPLKYPLLLPSSSVVVWPISGRRGSGYQG